MSRLKQSHLVVKRELLPSGSPTFPLTEIRATLDCGHTRSEYVLPANAEARANRMARNRFLGCYQCRKEGE